MSSVLPLFMSSKGPAGPTGDLYGWGANNLSQIGDNMGIATLSPTPANSTWKDIACSIGSGAGSIGIKTDGTLWVWGDQARFSGINSSSFYTLYSSVQVGSDTDWSKCFKGSNGGFAIKTNGTLWAWGVNTNGICGILSATDPIISPVQVGTDTNWSFVDCASSSNSTIVALKTNGTLWSWGTAANGTLGNGTTTPNISSPVQVGTLTNWASVSAGSGFVTAVKTDGTLWAWGLGTSGQLGDGTAVSKSSPIQVGTLTNWASVSAGSNFSMAVKTNGTLWAFGGNANGQLGDSTSGIDRSSPVQIGALTTWSKSIASYFPSGYALKTDGTLWSWGTGSFFQLGDGTLLSRSSPVQIGSFGGVTTFKLMAGWSQAAVYLLADNTLYGWGGGRPQLNIGLNGIAPRYTTSNVAEASFGVSHSCFIKSNGTMWGNGLNTSGQLGQNSTSTPLYKVPVQIGALTTWATVSAGTNLSMAVKTDGTLWGWGASINGGLGNGTTTPNISSPVQIGTLTNWAKVSVGSSYVLSIKTNGTLWAWGLNTSGQLGDGTTVDKSSPVQIGTLTTWAKVSAGTSFSMAVKTDGTLWAWGLGTSGQLGDGTNVSKSSPVQVGTLTNWLQCSSGQNFALAVKTDGTLWSWGNGGSGQLGDGTTVTKSSPVQIGTLSNWSQCLASTQSTGYALNTDGNVYAWGSGTNSQLANGDQTIASVSSPVLVGSGYTSLATNSLFATAGAII